MRYVKLFEEFSMPKAVYHNSGEKVPVLTNRPMWFSLTLEMGLGYFDNMMMDTGESHLYKATLKNGLKIMEDEAEEFFSSNDLDYQEWIVDVVGNPDQEDLLALEGTKTLIKAGYDGVVYPDYNPWDPSEDVETLILFDPKKSLTSWNEMNGEKELKALNR
jgi:hypothetical protein